MNQAHAHELMVKVLGPNNKPVENVVVYATPVAGISGLAANTEQLVISQEGKKFAPYLTVMQQGQSITFSNKDDITHHIYSVSGANRFEFKLQANSSKTTKKMQAAEEIAMGCNIHDWMSGYTLVVATPYYGKTDESGKFSINVKDLGDYQVSVWHPQLDLPNNRIEQAFTLTQSNTTMDIKLPKALLPLPEQLGEDDFDFLEEY